MAFDPALVLQSMMTTSPEAIVVTSLDGVVVGWSRGAENIFGQSAAMAVGHLAFDEVAPSPGGRPWAEVMKGLGPGDEITPYESTRQGGAGHAQVVEVSPSPIMGPDGKPAGLVAFLRDVTERKQTEEAMRAIEIGAHQRRVVMETANRVALDIIASRAGVEALRHIADAARVLAGARYSALGVARVHEQGHQELEIFVTVGITPQEQARIGPLPRGKGILGLLLTLKEPLRINNLADHPASVGFPANHPPMSSFLGVPIRRGEEVLGSLYLTDKQGGGPFTEADELAVQALGAHAAVAIHNLHMLTRQQALTRSLLTAQEEERRAVAYDLHDGLTQYVMGAHAHMQSFRSAHEAGNPEKAAREMDAGLRYLKEAVVESRRMVNNLRLLVLDDLGLAGALEQLIQEEKNRAAWSAADLAHDLDDQRFDRSVETTAYRIVQEALTNARKHASTERVRVTLHRVTDGRGEDALQIEIRDWGKGFEPESRSSPADHVGLQGIIERVHLLSGTYDLQSAPGRGTSLQVTLPISAPTDSDSVAGG